MANSGVHEILPMALLMKTVPLLSCDKAILKTVCGTYQTFTDKKRQNLQKEQLKMK